MRRFFTQQSHKFLSVCNPDCIAFQHIELHVTLFTYSCFVFFYRNWAMVQMFLWGTITGSWLRLLVNYTESHCTLEPYRHLDNFFLLDNQLWRPLSPCYYSTHDHHQHPSVYLLLLPSQKWIRLDLALKKVCWAFALEEENSIDLLQHIYMLHKWIIYQMTNKVRRDGLRVKTAYQQIHK